MSSFQNLFASKGVQQSVITVGGTFVSLGISAVTIILISRILGPSNFGIFSLVFAIVAILIKVGDVGFSFAFHKFVPASPQKDEVITDLNSLRLKWIVFSFIPMLLLSPLLTWSFQLPAWWIFPFSIFAGLMSISIEHLMAVLQSLEKFGYAVSLLSAQSILKLMVVGFLLFAGVRAGATATVLYFAVPSVVGILGFWWWRKYSKFAWNISSTRTQRYLPFIRHNSVQVISTAIADNLDILLIQVFLGVFATGVYGGVTRIALLISVLAFSLGNVLNVRVSKYKDRDDQQIYLKKVLTIGLFIIAGCVMTMLSAPWLIQFTVGPEYLVALPELRVLLLAAFIYAATIPLISFFYSTDTPDVFSKIGILLIVAMLLADVVLIPEFGLMGAAWGRVISRGVVLGYVGWRVRREIQKKVKSDVF